MPELFSAVFAKLFAKTVTFTTALCLHFCPAHLVIHNVIIIQIEDDTLPVKSGVSLKILKLVIHGI